MRQNPSVLATSPAEQQAAGFRGYPTLTDIIRHPIPCNSMTTVPGYHVIAAIFRKLADFPAPPTRCPNPSFWLEAPTAFPAPKETSATIEQIGRLGWTAAIGIEPQTHISRHERTLGRH